MYAVYSCTAGGANPLKRPSPATTPHQAGRPEPSHSNKKQRTSLSNITGSKRNNLRQRLLDPACAVQGGDPHGGMPGQALITTAVMLQALPQCSLPSPEALCTLTADDAASFAFTICGQPQQQQQQPAAMQQQVGTWGIPQAHALLLSSGASGQHVTLGWVENHWRMVVWKLASHDRVRLRSADIQVLTANVPPPSRDLTPQAVLTQLHHRYTQEAAEGRRSVLVKICQQDKSPQGPMVLTVSGLLNVSSSAAGEGAPVRISSTSELLQGTAGSTSSTGLALEVSDGWYCVPASIDAPLAALAAQGRIKVCVRGIHDFPRVKLHH
jgi:hypothetical protein